MAITCVDNWIEETAFALDSRVGLRDKVGSKVENIAGPDMVGMAVIGFTRAGLNEDLIVGA